MKTKFRILRSNNGEYKNLSLQFLGNKYKDSKYLDPLFEITFQSDNNTGYWYAYRLHIDTEYIYNIETALKIANFIDKNCYSKLPEEILSKLNGDEYIYYDSEFLPVRLNGCNSYHLMKNDKLYSRIYAFNETDAYKQAEEYTLKNHYESEVKWNIELYETKIILKSNINLLTL